MLWTPEHAEGPRPLVVLGHGGSRHKNAEYIVALAKRLVRGHAYAALAIDAHNHGERRADGGLDRRHGRRSASAARTAPTTPTR